MEKLIALLQDLAQSQSWASYLLLVLSALGGLLVVASGIVAMTPSKKDDELLLKLEQGKLSGLIWKFLKSFSVLKPKL